MIIEVMKPRNICGPTIARLRRNGGLTQDALRRKCAAAGWQVARSVLAKVEVQRRAVSDYELIALATALGVPVSKLLRTTLRKA